MSEPAIFGRLVGLPEDVLEKNLQGELRIVWLT